MRIKEKLSKVAVRIHDEDNVVTAVVPLYKGTEIADGSTIIKLKAEIPPGHKFAVTDIPCNSPVIKYGQIIGTASANIVAGDWVHVHNAAGRRGRGDLNNRDS